jgi:hypothetical protein
LFGFIDMSGPVISYVPFDELIASLRADALAGDADRLHFMLHKVAWTTGSELIGELGQAMKDVAREHGGSFSDSTRARMETAFEMVLTVWPDFPR